MPVSTSVSVCVSVCASVCVPVCVWHPPHHQPTSAPLATFPSTGQAADLLVLDTAAARLTLCCWSSSPERPHSPPWLVYLTHLTLGIGLVHIAKSTYIIWSCCTHFQQFITAPGSNHLKFKTLGLESWCLLQVVNLNRPHYIPRSPLS